MKQISDKNSLLLLSSRYLVIEYWYRKLIDRSFVSDLLSIKNAAIITIQYNKSGWEKSDQITGQVFFFYYTSPHKYAIATGFFFGNVSFNQKLQTWTYTAIIDEYIWDRYISNPDKRKGNPYYYYYYDCQITNWGLSGLIITTCLSRWEGKASPQTYCLHFFTIRIVNSTHVYSLPGWKFQLQYFIFYFCLRRKMRYMERGYLNNVTANKLR